MTDRTLTASDSSSDSDSDSDSWTRMQTNYRTARAEKATEVQAHTERLIHALSNAYPLPATLAAQLALPTAAPLAATAAALQLALEGASRWEVEPPDPESLDDPFMSSYPEFHIRLALPSPAPVPYLRIRVSRRDHGNPSGAFKASYADATDTPAVTLPAGAVESLSLSRHLSYTAHKTLEALTSSITVSWDRPAKAHASEILRRLIPDMFTRYLTLADSACREQHTYDLTKATVERLTKAGAFEIVNDYARTEDKITLRLPAAPDLGLIYDIYLTVQGDTVNIERLRLTPEGAETLIEAFTYATRVLPWTPET